MISHSSLRRAVERGIISQEQLDGLLGEANDPETPQPPPPVEAPQTFNAITVAYYLGAFVVLFAFGWFLVDRWRALGTSGILIVALVYAALFVGSSEYLRRHGFTFASAVAMLLAVGMTPLVTWALLDLGGAWPQGVRSCEWDVPFVFGCRGKWMVIELATILASLVALRRVKNALLMEPIAIALLILTFHIVESLFGRTFDSTAAGWAIIVAASLLMLLAYTVDLRNRSDHDYAFSLYIPALIAGFAGMQMLWSFDHTLRHALLPIALTAFAVALYMRRRVFLIFGAMTFVWYLGYLAFDVFRNVVALPIMLATIGFLVILGAVWLQRNYPRIVASVSESNRGQRMVPVGQLLFLTPALLGLLMIPLAGGIDSQLQRERRQQQQASAIKWKREERVRAATRDSLDRSHKPMADTVTSRAVAPR